MLQEVKDLQNDAVRKLVDEVKKGKKETVFKAPTGSGKTFMMADFMNRYLAERNDVIFLVSSLSKGDLARQNYEKFCEYSNRRFFANVNPYLINSEIAGEERLYIPDTYNVYVLPRDLYKKASRIKEQGVLFNFFLQIRSKGKFIFLIKDECHIATKNLDGLNDSFEKIINLSATPKLSRGQHPDVEISNESAVNAKLIKSVEWGEKTDTVEDAINKFENIKDDYRNKLGVNPCLIIQISNKGKADYELNNTIFPILNKQKHQDLKWMLIVDKNKDCNTNDIFKAKKLPVEKWKDYAKHNMANIDIIIFKMVITEGWDIPRACMLYQVRDARSEQLNEQVMGRVRRNPRLLDFETLSEDAQNLAMTAWVWGVQPNDGKKFFGVKLWDEPEDITENIKIKVTKLKSLTSKVDFDLHTFLSNQQTPLHHRSIFELGRNIANTSNEVRNIIYNYSSSYEKWWEVAEFVDDIAKENEKYVCDYAQSMEVEQEDGKAREVSFAVSSHYTDEGNYINIGNWVWKRSDGADKFAFDSDAEREWASILKDLSNIDNNDSPPQKAVAQTKVGKKNKATAELTGQKNLFGKVETGKINEEDVFLWGKNYVPNSAIKFEYYMGALRSSYPDFIMKDAYNRIHIFEVKSVNEGHKIGFDNNIYKMKVSELKKAYKQASLLTNQIFYLPLTKKGVWEISRYVKGNEDILTKDEFITKVKTQEIVITKQRYTRQQ
ncbi:MAG: DEAD/DEAH box helicase family protein [Prevotellaceae bacterium]|jgi:type III restriction enzyme|nr:DEAD/DEAH box helicase family protein [Prevotellaceae bacterium]